MHIQIHMPLFFVILLSCNASTIYAAQSAFDDTDDDDAVLLPHFTEQTENNHFLFTSEELFLRSAHLKFNLENVRNNRNLVWHTWIRKLLLLNALKEAAIDTSRLSKKLTRTDRYGKQRTIEITRLKEAHDFIAKLEQLEDSLNSKMALMRQQRAQQLAEQRQNDTIKWQF